MSEQKKEPYLSVKRFASTPVRSPIQPVYRAGNPGRDRNYELVQTGERDIRQVVQSNYVNCFDYILDRFLDSGIAREELLTGGGMSPNQDFLLDVLDLNSEYVDTMEEAREVFGLSPDLTYSEIRDKLQSMLDEQKGVSNETQKKNESSQSPEDQSSTQSAPVQNDSSSDSVGQG